MIRNWHQFERIRHSGKPLLEKLPTLNRPVLVAGCQRSGTTAVTRILRSGGDFFEPSITRDDELDAALILAGEVAPPQTERMVLQTTYLNDHYREYFNHNNFQLVWIVRNPHAVINSMLHNWSRGALRRLFKACGYQQLDEDQRGRYVRLAHWTFSRLEMACYSYIEKSRQAAEIKHHLSDHQIRFLDYDQLIAEPERSVEDLCEFFEISYSGRVAQSLTRNGSGRATNRLSKDQKILIDKLCSQSWLQNLELATGTQKVGVLVPNE